MYGFGWTKGQQYSYYNNSTTPWKTTKHDFTAERFLIHNITDGDAIQRLQEIPGFNCRRTYLHA